MDADRPAPGQKSKTDRPAFVTTTPGGNSVAIAQADVEYFAIVDLETQRVSLPVNVHRERLAGAEIIKACTNHLLFLGVICEKPCPARMHHSLDDLHLLVATFARRISVFIEADAEGKVAFRPGMRVMIVPAQEHRGASADQPIERQAGVDMKIAFIEAGIGTDRVAPAFVREQHERIALAAITSVRAAQNPNRLPGPYKNLTIFFSFILILLLVLFYAKYVGQKSNLEMTALLFLRDIRL